MYSCPPTRLSSYSAYTSTAMDQGERKNLNSELWHACAGPLVSLPSVGTRVVYFPQGHSEQVAVSTHKEADSQIPNYPRLPSRLICLLENVTLHAEPETDEVYAQMLLLPIQSPEKESSSAPDLGVPNRQPTEYFCKTLTASDTSTHGGFSIPRRAAEKVFPPLDYTQQPPAQELVARDLHDQEWHFRHIYRGQPRRHLLTTGWSVFVSAKRLQAGDSVLFIRDDKGQLLLGIRRANRQQTNLPSSVLSSDTMHIGVLAAANHAAEHTSRFTIFYNPRQSPAEFVVPLAKYHKAVYNTHVTVGMRFRMVFETEESSIRRYMGTITGIADLDPVRWPKSHWRSLKVNWDESTAGERQKRVSLWEIEPLTTSFLLCPSPFTMRSKRPRGVPGEEDDLELLMRKSHMWQNSSDMLSPLNFGVGGLPMDTSWMRLPQPRAGTAVPSPHYRALAAAALQEIRTGDPAKQLLSQPLQSTQMQLRQQQPQSEPQQLMLQMNDVPGPLLQLSTSHTQMMESGTCGRASSYTESDLQIPPSPSSISGSFSLSGMMGRVQNNATVNPSEGNQYATMMHTDSSALQPCRTMQGGIQITSAWFPPLQNGLQSDPQSIVSPRLSQVEASSTAVPGSYSVSQNNEPSVQQGLGLPYGFHNHGQDSEQMQGDKSHFLFGVPIDQPQVASAALTSQNFGKPKDAPDSNILLGYCPPAAPDSINNGLISNDSLDENMLFHQSSGWPAMQTAARQRTYIKVHKTGVPGRSLDVRNFSNYTELRKALAQKFNLENLLEDPEKSGWQIVFVDTENDTLLLGDDPWEEFVTYVRSIKILSPHEVAQMNQDQLEMLNAVPTQQHQRPSTSNSEEAHPQSSLPNPSSGTLDI